MIARRAVAALLVTLALTARAEPNTAAQAEIDHLLAFVAASPCTFIRNGTEYPAAKAREHLAEKFNAVKRRIDTADDFIRHVATQSSTTGEPYKVKCAATELTAAAWLTAELKRHRTAAR